MESNKVINKIILNIVEVMYVTEDKEQLQRFSNQIDKFNRLFKIKEEK